jgi:hypothetical protein
MSDALVAYAESLPPEERDLLLSSVPFLISLCVGADQLFDQREVEAAADVLIDSTGVLGDAFRHSAAAEGAFDVIAARAEAGWTSDAEARLEALGAVVRKMPSDVQRPYHAFVEKMCLHLVESSREHVFWGKKISAEEKKVLQHIALRLGVPLNGKLAAALG